MELQLYWINLVWMGLMQLAFTLIFIPYCPKHKYKYFAYWIVMVGILSSWLFRGVLFSFVDTSKQAEITNQMKTIPSLSYEPSEKYTNALPTVLSKEEKAKALELLIENERNKNKEITK